MGICLPRTRAGVNVNGGLDTDCQIAELSMQRLLLIAACLLYSNAIVAAQNEQKKAVEIPLDKVWGYNMPGTANVEKLEPKPQGTLFSEIRRSLWSLPPKQKNAGPAFAVTGTEAEALRGVHAVLVKGKKPQQSFPHDSEIYVVFFSYQNQPYVHLHKVERQENVINVRWRFVPHETEETTEHFALIPLGKLPSGKYRVNILRSPMEKKYIDLGIRETSDKVADRNVCRSFSFSVDEQRETDTADIGLDQIWAYGMPGTRDIGKLEPNKIPNYKYGPLVGEILHSLRNAPAKDQDTKPGFAVLGTGMQALREAHTVLVRDKRPRDTFPAGSEVSLVFFSHQFNAYVHLHKVERQGTIAKINYLFVRHESHEETEHFALIPLGKLPSGKFDVQIVQSPSERPVSDKVARRIVSQPFSFSVADRESK